MLTSIRRQKLDEAAGPDAIDLLVECHGRIRQFTNIALRLAHAKGVDEGEIREAASRLIRYFTIALPLHSEDEETSLHDRLQASEAPSEIKEAIERMVEEHGPIHATIDELVHLWKTLVDAPSRLADDAEPLRKGAEELARLFDEHLAQEESIIFPAARQYLQPEALAEILEEMRARREAKGAF